jgi:hypothetical protein
MRAVACALVLSLMPFAAHGGDAEGAFGPLRLGMSYDELRAATPAVTWIPQIPGMSWNPAVHPRFPYDYEMRGMKAKRAFAIGGETFDVEYEDAAWGRYRLSANFEEQPAKGGDTCANRIFRVMEAVAAANGALEAPTGRDQPGAGRQQLKLGVGKNSSALMSTNPVKGFTLNAERKTGALSVEVSGGTSGADQSGCWIKAELALSPARPPQGTVEAEALQITHPIGIGAMHHSLDDAPPLPPTGVEARLNCTIRDNGTVGCDEAAADAQSPFLAAAKLRIRDMRVARRTRDGRWTPGEHTSLVIKIAPEDRRIVDATQGIKSPLLKMVDRSYLPPRFPRAPLEAGVSGNLRFTCVVQADGSPICPQISVDPPKFRAEFLAAALPVVLFSRHALQLTNGESAVGAAFETEMAFKLE